MVSPACAGMIPALSSNRQLQECEPRMRGDDPTSGLDVLEELG